MYNRHMDGFVPDCISNMIISGYGRLVNSMYSMHQCLNSFGSDLWV